MSKKLARFVLTLFILTAGCGKEGPPSPPVPDIPAPVSDLVVSQRDDRVMLRWSYPSLTTSGKSLQSIEKIAVYRFDEGMPPSLAEREIAPVPDTPSEIALFAQVAAPTPTQFERAGVPISEMAGQDLPAFSRGAYIVYEDQPPIRSSDGTAMRYTYAVITEGTRVQSALSNLASIVPQQPVAQPKGFLSRMSPETIELAWAPTSQTDPDAAPVIGYRVYRSAAGGLGELVNASPVKETVLRDAPPYGTYSYRVVAVGALEPDIESAPSDPVTVEFQDMLPPPTPVNFEALLEVDSVRLIWDRVPAEDLAGYLVYRWDGVARVKITEELVIEPSYRDVQPATGIEYIYGVTSVDRQGNESQQAVSEPVTVTR